MSEITDVELLEERTAWILAGRPIPLEVCSSGYDDDTVSWEVLYTETPWDGNSGSSAPIAEFTTWQEAQDWAVLEARKSTMHADSRRTLGPMTEEQQWRHDVWEAWSRFEGEHPFRLEHLRPGGYPSTPPHLRAETERYIAEDEARRGPKP